MPICQRGELDLLILSEDFMNANENIVCAIRTDINHFEEVTLIYERKIRNIRVS